MGSGHKGQMNIPAFVDDIRFMTENLDQLFQMSNILIEETEKTGLTINHDKTKLMFLRRRSRRCQIIGNQWTINNHATMSLRKRMDLNI